MMIRTLSIHGYKSIEKLEQLPLNRLNVLIGSNGSGKSNFLSAFHLLIEISKGNLQGYSQQQGIDSLLRYGRKYTKKLIFSIQEEENYYLVQLAPSLGEQLLISEEMRMLEPLLQHKVDEEENNAKIFQKEGIHAKSFFLKDKFIFNEGLNLPEEMIYWRDYHFNDTSPLAALKRPCLTTDNLLLKSDGSNLAAFWQRIVTEAPNQADKILKTLRLVLPFLGGLQVRKMNEDTVKLEWFERGQPDTPLSVHALSDGSLRLICLVILLLQPEAWLPHLLLIDEPEIALHPKAIHLLGDLIKRASEFTQVIISTQSPLLLDAFSAEDIIVVERENEASTFKRLDALALSVWLDEYHLSELWQKNILGG